MYKYNTVNIKKITINSLFVYNSSPSYSSSLYYSSTLSKRLKENIVCSMDAKAREEVE
jgi:hypothetical protein